MTRNLKKIYNTILNNYATIFMLFSNVLNKGLGLISTIVITRFFTQSEYGIWSCTLNIYGYIELLSGFGLAAGAYQFGMEVHGTVTEYKYYKYCLKNGVIINGIIIAFSMLLLFFFELPIVESKIYAIAICPLLIFSYILIVLEYIFLSENRIIEYAKVLNINTFFNVICVCIGSTFGIKGVIIGQYIAIVLSLLQVTYKLRNELLLIFKVNLFRFKEVVDMWHYSIFNGISSALNMLLYLVDITMVATITSSAEQISIYKVATLIPTALCFIPQSIITANLPRIVYNRSDKCWQKKHLKKLYTRLALLNFCICLFICLFAPFIIKIIFGEKYLSAIPVFMVLIVGFGISGTFRIPTLNFLAGFRRVNFNLFISITSVILNIILNYFLIANYQIIGAAYSTLIIQIVTSLLALCYLICYLNCGEKKC